MLTLNYQTPPPRRDWRSYLWDRHAGEWLVWAALFYVSGLLIATTHWAPHFIAEPLVWVMLTMSFVANLMSWKCARGSILANIISVVLMLWTVEPMVAMLFYR